MSNLISDGAPIYLAHGKGKQFRLSKSWEFDLDSIEGILYVPKGFKSDLASVPLPFFWWQFGKWNIAAIAHDFLYENGYIEVRHPMMMVEDRIEKRFFDKKQSDRIFYEICLAVGVDPLTSILMYCAVRIFGRGIW